MSGLEKALFNLKVSDGSAPRRMARCLIVFLT
jgi:hypothetical protein